MKKTILSLLLSIFVWVGNAYEARNLLQNAIAQNQLATTLLTQQRWITYPAYTDRNGWNALLGSHSRELVADGEKYLNYQWQYLRATQYLAYERVGSREAVNTPTVQNIKALSALLLAELAEGKGRFVDAIIDGVFFFCEQTTWAEAAHLQAYQKSKRALPDHTENILELRQGGISQLLAWTYYFLHNRFDEVDPVISKRLYHELDRRELTPYLERNDFWWMALPYEGQMVNNWNPWCNSNALLCFMILENNTNRLAQAVWKSMQSVDQYINYVQADGCCEEGATYWGHAAGKLFDYLLALQTITGGKVSIFNQPLIKNMGEYIAQSYIGNDYVVNFADASARMSNLSPTLVFNYGRAVNSPLMQAFATMLYRKSGVKVTDFNWMDFFTAMHSLQALPLMEAYTGTWKPAPLVWYPQTEVCYMRTPRAFFAAKGGNNNESHNHNDVGTCVFYLDNTPILIDAGVGTYTSKTFSSQRYTIWTMQSLYHNLPVINGRAQRNGTDYRSSLVEVNARRRSMTVDMAGAYPTEAAVKSYRRTYNLRRQALDIADTYTLLQATEPMVVHFLTWGKVELGEPGVVNVEVNGVKATLRYPSAQFKASLETVPISDPRLTRVWGNQVVRLNLTALQASTQGAYRFAVEAQR